MGEFSAVHVCDRDPNSTNPIVPTHTHGSYRSGPAPCHPDRQLVVAAVPVWQATTDLDYWDLNCLRRCPHRFDHVSDRLL